MGLSSARSLLLVAARVGIPVSCGHVGAGKNASPLTSYRAMYYGLYMSAAGAHAQNTKVEVISNNLANVNTVGFKRELALLHARESEAIERGAVGRGTGAIEDVGGGTRMNA